MTGTLSLAAAIAEFDRAELEALLYARKPSGLGNIDDPLSLALELLRPDSIARALSGLDRHALTILLRIGKSDYTLEHAAPADAATLSRLALVGRQNGVAVALPEVTAELRAQLANAGVLAEALLSSPIASTAPVASDTSWSLPPLEDPAESSPSTPQASPDWFAPAFASVRRAAALLRQLREQPARVSRRGAVAVTSLRELAERSRGEQGATERLIHTLQLAGLVRTEPGTTKARGDAATVQLTLVRTPAASDWLALAPADRWLALATGRISSMSDPLRRTLYAHVRAAAPGSGPILPVNLNRVTEVDLREQYPLLPARSFDSAAEFATAAEELGLTFDGIITQAALALLREDTTGAAALTHAAFPAPVAGVYLQPDLSIVVPGPLDSQLEEQLLAIVEAEQFGVAMSLRITTASLMRAFERGWNAERVRALLETLSLTGIPQPLSYLLDDLARTHGSIRVSHYDGDAGRSLVRAERIELLQALQLDRALQHLQFAEGPEPNTLLSRLSAEHVASSLSEARHPATLVTAHGGPHMAPTEPSAAEQESLDTAIDTSDTVSLALSDIEVSAAAERIHDAARQHSGAGDVSRRLELAIREKTTLRITAQAGAEARSFLLLPISLNAGRLRASDQTAGVERTIPLSAITAAVEA